MGCFSFSGINTKRSHKARGFDEIEERVSSVENFQILESFVAFQSIFGESGVFLFQ
jgi:hypothetical protein